VEPGEWAGLCTVSVGKEKEIKKKKHCVLKRKSGNEKLTGLSCRELWKEGVQKHVGVGESYCGAHRANGKREVNRTMERETGTKKVLGRHQVADYIAPGGRREKGERGRRKSWFACFVCLRVGASQSKEGVVTDLLEFNKRPILWGKRTGTTGMEKGKKVERVESAYLIRYTEEGGRGFLGENKT